MIVIVREVRNAWRRLIRRPGYTLLSVTVLGVGLGVTVFLFSLVNTLILQPMPFPHADQLVTIGEASANGTGVSDIDSLQYLGLQDRLGSVDETGGYASSGVSLAVGNGAKYFSGGLLTSSMMSLLGVKPMLGRGLRPGDDQPGAQPVVLIGERLWRNEFNASPDVIGRVVRVNGEWVTVVGVLPGSFGFPGDSQLWLPLRVSPGHYMPIINMVGRLKPSVSLSQARQELSALDTRLRAESRRWRDQAHTVMRPLSMSIVHEDMRRWVWMMFGAGVLVLLLACVNVANLQLVQTLNRHSELALRSALGSSRMRLMLGALAESLILSVAALALALPIVHWGNRWIVSTYQANGQAPPSWFDFDINGNVLAFALLAAGLSTAFAGLFSSWRASRTQLGDALRDGSKGSSGGFARVATALVVAEVALTVVLLVGAGTFVRALDTLLAQPSNGTTHAAQVLTAQVALPPKACADDAARIRFFESVAQRLRLDARVVSATVSNTIPGAELGSHETIAAAGQPRPSVGWPFAQMGIVDPHFLDTYGISLTKGRFFGPQDTSASAQVTVIDAKAAAALWPGRDPLGQKLILYPGKSWARTVSVIGVIEPLQLDSMLGVALPGLLMPVSQAAGQSPLRRIGIAVRTHTKAVAFEQSLSAAVRSVDAQAATFGVRSQTEAIAAGRISLVVLTQVFSALGLVALLLAAAGLYGVLAFSVAQRTREIGIRRAIGADNRAIVREVGRTLAWQLGLGLVIGGLVALPWSSLLADPNLRTRAHDPAVFVPVLALVVLVAVVSALVPLLRALRVDPAVALRYE